VVILSKNRVTATAIANSKIEVIRNLSYESVGTIGAVLPQAVGILAPIETETLNNTVYTIDTKIEYVVDEADGSGSADTCDLDYKKVEVKVSWDQNHSEEVVMTTEVAPDNLVQEANACAAQPGGVLKVTIFDTAGAIVSSPTIKIYDETGNTLYGITTPVNGSHTFALAAGTYRVEVEKNNYVPTRTYSTAEVAIPDNPDPSVLNGYATAISLPIDQVASLTVEGISPTGEDYFADSFADALHIADSNHIQVVDGELKLAGPNYFNEGEAASVIIAPDDIVSWDQLRFDSDIPIGTKALFQLEYYDGANWILIPDFDLTGNSSGFVVSPINLAGLNKDVYPQLRIKAHLTTTDASVTPAVADWELSWVTGSGVPIGEASFWLRGTKTIGKDALGNPVYKYSQKNNLDAAGRWQANDISGDAYIFSTEASSSLALIATNPSPQPINALPGTETAVKIFCKRKMHY